MDYDEISKAFEVMAKTLQTQADDIEEFESFKLIVNFKTPTMKGNAITNWEEKVMKSCEYKTRDNS